MSVQQQVLVALVCAILAGQQINAVVNNAAKNGSLDADKQELAAAENEASRSNQTEPPNAEDSKAEASESNADRREAPTLTLQDSYGAPLPSGSYGLPLVDSYTPPEPSNPGLPVPVYGVPDAPSNNNIVYPAPPPDIPPPIPHQVYGPPQQLPQKVYGPPPVQIYGPPAQVLFPRPPKPFAPPPFKNVKPLYGPPRLQYGAPLKFNGGAKFPKPTYGMPKPVYGPPKPFYGPPKINGAFGGGGFLNPPPKVAYGPPAKFGGYKGGGFGHAPVSSYGPPEPIPQRPPPGVPAPPTPPDIKYDGWQPIPGLVSRPPANTYGPPPEHAHADGGDLHLNADFVPPPIGGGQIAPVHGDAHGLHQNDHGISLGLAAAGLGNNNIQDQQLSVIKSVGYEIFQNTPVGDTYSAPPSSALSADGPYAAAQIYDNGNAFSFDTTLDSGSHSLPLPSAGVGLIPPSGVYGVPPSGQYGTPLLPNPTNNAHLQGHPLNALEINPPKRPVVFREPVPVGLIQSIGNSVAQKDAHGIIEPDSSFHSKPPTYIPPPVPEITKQQDAVPSQPSSLYSLPNADNAVSFQKIAHGSSSDGLINNFNDGSYNLLSSFDGSHAFPLTSYTAPLGIIDGSYGLPNFQAGTSVGLDHSHAASTIDLTGINLDLTAPEDSEHSASTSFQTIQRAPPYDCTNHKSQPLPVPAELTSGPGDLKSAYSQKSTVSVGIGNLIENKPPIKDPHGKSLEGIFGPGSELIKSQSIDFNNIPVKGARGSYTLQIQSANRGKSGNLIPVPHNQVLSEGLLQSILAAIEGPQGTGKADISAKQKTVNGVQNNNDGSALDTNDIALYFSNNVDKHRSEQNDDYEKLHSQDVKPVSETNSNHNA